MCLWMIPGIDQPSIHTGAAHSVARYHCQPPSLIRRVMDKEEEWEQMKKPAITICAQVHYIELFHNDNEDMIRKMCYLKGKLIEFKLLKEMEARGLINEVFGESGEGDHGHRNGE